MSDAAGTIAGTTATATTGATAGATTGAKPATTAPLDDVMLAMDVVDTLRRRRRLVERELDAAGREQDLKGRLRQIYAAQGIEVTDAILEEGVRALNEDRFVYVPPPESFGLKLARVYVNRGVWGKWVLGALAGLALGIAAWQWYVVAPRDALPRDLQAMHAEVVALAAQARDDAQADRLLAAGRQALRDGDTGRAGQLLAELTAMRNQLELTYRIQVVNRPGERTGVFRIPDVNEAARNYYIIVEALSPDGRRLPVPVRNEETGKLEQASQWGLRVDENTFNRVAADKQDDGIIQEDILGHKKPGVLEPTYRVQTSGAAITSW